MHVDHKFDVSIHNVWDAALSGKWLYIAITEQLKAPLLNLPAAKT